VRIGSRAAGPRTLLNIGYGNLVVSSRVVAIVGPGAAPMKRLRDEAAARNKLIDTTQGRRTRSIIILDDDHVVLSAINPETIATRFEAGFGAEEAGGGER
jgi:regulator of extracellular matrix RemA (YlzA/DUF370 family)